MKADELKWDKRYQNNRYPKDPLDVLVNNIDLAKKGRALDIAAGSGRHSIFLADKGFKVDAVDISKVGLSRIQRKRPEVNTFHEDLDTYQIEENVYDLIVNVNFLDRRLFPYIIRGLKDGGLLIFQTFIDPRVVGEKLEAHKKDQYLRENELLHAFLSLKVIEYREPLSTVFSTGQKLKLASLIARKSC